MKKPRPRSVAGTEHFSNAVVHASKKTERRVLLEQMHLARMPAAQREARLTAMREYEDEEAEEPDDSFVI